MNFSVTLQTGVPELDMPPLDPFVFKNHTAVYESGQLRGQMTAIDVRTYGLAKANFLSVKSEMNDDFFRLDIDVEIPKVLLEGNYIADGNLGSFKVGGKGTV